MKRHESLQLRFSFDQRSERSLHTKNSVCRQGDQTSPSLPGGPKFMPNQLELPFLEKGTAECDHRHREAS